MQPGIPGFSHGATRCLSFHKDQLQVLSARWLLPVDHQLTSIQLSFLPGGGIIFLDDGFAEDLLGSTCERQPHRCAQTTADNWAPAKIRE